ncbi:MAG: M1 family metallopeptidase [Acidobacteria bacterium]|nr:M1 family metallopeptidase [Acidobacteriota bacterium]
MRDSCGGTIHRGRETHRRRGARIVKTLCRPRYTEVVVRFHAAFLSSYTLCALAFAPFAAAQIETAAAAVERLRESKLDPRECYRVRDIAFTAEDARFYLTDGYLIFRRPVNGVTVSALFSADTASGDGEVLLIPPHRSERISLASFTQSPTLNQHFKTALFVFSDGTGEELRRQVAATNARRAPEEGLLLAQRWDSTVQNIAASFTTRLVRDLLGTRRTENGFFYAAVSTPALGNFDLVIDPRARNQVTAGQISDRDGRSFFDLWMHFEARSFRDRRRQRDAIENKLSDYKLDVTLTPELGLKAVTEMTLTPAQTGERAAAFDISPRMRVTGASIDGKPVELFQREGVRANLIRGDDNELFLLVAPEELEAGRPYRVRIEHEGNVVTHAGNKVYYVASRGNWYPQGGLQFSTYETVFRYPKNLRLVSSGDLVEDATSGDTRITRRRAGSPIRLLGFNLGEYEQISTNRAGYLIDVYANKQFEAALTRVPMFAPLPAPFPRRNAVTRPELTPLPLPASPVERLKHVAGEVGAALEFMASRFGPPPLKTLTVSPIPGTFGQGFPGLLYLSTMAYLDPADRPWSQRSESHRLFFSELIHAHETAHQWWGNTVISAGYQDDWLQEALANYSAVMFLERRKGPRLLDAVLEDYKRHLLSKTPDGEEVQSVGPVTQGLRLQSSKNPDAWRTIMYEKGTWILHMLRRQLGDERFLALLADLTKRYRFAPLSTAAFQSAASEQMPATAPDRKLEAFFENWVYGTGVPALKVAHTVRGTAPRVRVTVTVTQTGVGDDFSVDVPVEIQIPRSRPVTRWVRTSNEPATIQLTAAAAPTRVVVDPGNSILKR